MCFKICRLDLFSRHNLIFYCLTAYTVLVLNLSRHKLFCSHSPALFFRQYCWLLEIVWIPTDYCAWICLASTCRRGILSLTHTVTIFGDRFLWWQLYLESYRKKIPRPKMTRRLIYCDIKTRNTGHIDTQKNNKVFKVWVLNSITEY